MQRGRRGAVIVSYSCHLLATLQTFKDNLSVGRVKPVDQMLNHKKRVVIDRTPVITGR